MKWPLVLLVLLASLGAAIVARELYRPYRGYSGALAVTIEPGTRAPRVAGILVGRGVLYRRWPFLVAYAIGRLRHRRLKAGNYVFDEPVRPIDVYCKLVRGEVQLTSVVIPEGSDRFDIALILKQQLGVNSQEFLRITSVPFPIRDLDSRAPTLEGYLFPDTYRFARGVGPATVAFAMLNRYRRIVESKFGPKLAESPLGLHGVMTLASLVEKETPDPAERPIVAGVFSRRLEMGWALQCDPTVVYAARLNHDPNGHFDARSIENRISPITQSELSFDSPYNTYRYPGLPPGPIANPGEASIRAALDPAPGEFLYFVSNNQGGHNFAGTLAEHQRNVARYRRQLAQLRGAIPDSDPARARSARKKTAGPSDARVRPTKRAKHTHQKRKNHRVLPRAGSRARGPAGNPGH